MKSTFSCLGVIPVRLESTRLPQKPLRDIYGKTLVERVWLQAKKSSAVSKLVVATCNAEIAQECEKKGIAYIMTGSHHETGTDRVAEVSAILEAQGEVFDFVANIQGDMPFINPTVVDSTIRSLADSDLSLSMATIATPIVSREEFERPASVKIAIGEGGRALYFSRAPIPHWRNFPGDEHVSVENPYGYRHMGLYVFRREALKQIATLPKAHTEQREALEQLRALAHGIGIKVSIVSREAVKPNIEVDTPEDLENATQYARENGL
jgi:3-deoxy-manno-octulosonate cytidylyltransferase (CMP-KDO synthetase)